MIKRVTADAQLITNRFPEHSEGFFNKIQHLQPTVTDLSGAVEGLLRLQYVYKLKSEDFAEGIIDGVKTRSNLTAHDLFVIGGEAFKLENQDFFAKEYLNMAWDRVKSGRDANNEVDESFLLLHLAECYSRTGDFVNEIKVVAELIKMFPEDEKFVEFKKLAEESLAKYGNSAFVQFDPYSDEFERNGEFDLAKEQILYSQVCRGNITKSLKELSRLRCRFAAFGAFSKLAPFKIEEANLDPYIIQYIDVLSDDEVEFLKNRSKPEIERAFVGWGSDSKSDNRRIAQISWHFDDEHEVLERIARRVDVT